MKRIPGKPGSLIISRSLRLSKFCATWLFVTSDNFPCKFPISAVNCGDPGSAVNGNTTITNGNNWKSIVTYKCLIGHIKESGTNQRECVANETHASWTGSTLICKSMPFMISYISCFIFHFYYEPRTGISTCIFPKRVHECGKRDNNLSEPFF